MQKAVISFFLLLSAVQACIAQTKTDPRVIFGSAGAAADDMLKWDGAKWVPGRADVAVVSDSAAFRAFSAAIAPKIIILADSLRGGKFRRCYSCAVDNYMVFLDSLLRKWERYDFGDAVCVTWYGAKPNDDSSDSIAIQRAFNSPYNVFFPAGNWIGATHTISSAKRIWGTGNATITQRSQLSAQARIITIVSDGVTLENMALVGQITTQTGEFSHAVCVGRTVSDVTAVGVKNITLRNLTISDIRGDGIIIVASGLAVPYYCESVIAENIAMDNIFRNGISVISGKKCRFENIRLTRIGLWGFDLEPDIANQVGEEITVKNIWGPGIAVGHHAALNQNIIFENFYCEGRRQGSSPVYSTNPLFKVGVNVRQTSNASFKNGVVHNFGGYGLEIGATTVPFRNVVFESVTFDSTTLDASFSNSKLIDQSDSGSDSAFTFISCRFDGRGALAQLGVPVGSVLKNCVVRRFDRLMISNRGKSTFEGCEIDCYNDLIYASAGGSVFDNCDLGCTYIVRGEDVEGNTYTFRNCRITAVTPYYNFFGASPNTRFVWLNNTLNGAASQNVANGGTIFGTHVKVTGTTTATITVPGVFRHPLNRIYIDNPEDGRTVIIAPETGTIVGASTFSTQTSAVITTDGTNWYSYKAAAGAADGNGIYGGNGTVPNGTTATMANDFTFAGTDATGTQTPAFRVTAAGTDPGCQTWATSSGSDSVMLYFLDGEPFLQGYGGDFWLSAGSDDIRLQGETVTHHANKTILQGLIAVPHITVAADVTVTENTEEIDCAGHTAPFTVTLDYTSNLLGTYSRTVTIRNRSATHAVTLSRGSQSWQWALLDGTTTTANQTLAAGETALITWDDALSTDYYILQKIPAASAGASSGETIISPAQLTAAADNWNPTGLSTATVVRLSGDSGFRIISGITAPASPKELTLTNVGTDYPVLITREDVASSAANRFAIEKDIPLYPGQTATFFYDNTSNRWRNRNKSTELRPEQTQSVFYSAGGSTTSADFDQWIFTTASGVFSTVAPTATRRRAVTMSTSTSATAGPYITTKAASIWIGISPNPTAMYYRATFSVDSLSNATWGNYTLVAGFVSGPNALTSTTAEGEYFKYTHGINSGKWVTTTKQTTGSPNATTTDTGITFSAGTIYTVEVQHRPDGAAAFWINGTYITEHTANIEAQYTYPIVLLKKSSGTVARILTLDEIVFEENRP